MLNSRTNKHHRSKKIKKHSRSGKVKSLKSLHGALLNLLNKEKSPTDEREFNKKSYLHRKSGYHNTKTSNHNDIIYIRSKENVLIPKLTDDEVMERHKIADENMKNVWTNIIAKYENADDSKGDLINLSTGEIIEDNGHVRELSTLKQPNQTSTSYKTTFGDILLDDEIDDTTNENIQNPKQIDSEKLADSEDDEGNSLWAETESDNDFEGSSSSQDDEDDDDDIESS
ncbi:similar to Saccharomyces cerevisiae YDL139C SCM3 Nonhistone component of centromeric chromatin that binds stoichiometrically to CenH3-H4 histones, required for kinetochore assembly [Maudiozyma saulgeensis]|uniref:Similar to Saccharomyces cerevisiae YDL139C SCM3 Nonhistone component of centromeric chromatin that binds stoichiometrically to CenH3-H4 histones, required for kinetochore assembly n=1 Tax=Maudiozyma saulgeensis TaxID=1789683 RepID=A0A1X7QXW7_9SACH|nr:similar to Saccharomyces cerevisiae YDL139C SCM3 Nonhistone component of centromeric chromatin that binds stoichiometrically to CenH3-H4 histones, required for kinetochore assembly [Kazachstania saulgeensis]